MQSPLRLLVGLAVIASALVGCIADEDTAADADPQPTSTVRPVRTEEFASVGYNIGYDFCQDDQDALFEEAGTTSLERAAAHVSEGFREGMRDSVYQGCLDALRGVPSRFE